MDTFYKRNYEEDTLYKRNYEENTLYKRNYEEDTSSDCFAVEKTWRV